ncbi:ribose-5-phosphate isomerase [Desulfuromusa kysingii]|uniref:Ribose-5-phosphate isomerase n=1 Tax=Desulfuromusa kysingii TaxID=37625 RepID=A0A1H4D336_9BACT|nr:ribose 5-phosphate isomerase B [Desulfuromusa kysingii]SEA67047.1 ribose-5-phosphate isomerase [Desulfuromusa kysingii]
MLVIGSDHGGYELKTAIIELLKERGVEFADLGTDGGDSVDYPDFAEKVAGAVSTGEADLGILICGTGIGMSISANKFAGVRAALVHDEFTAQMAREHNNANILVMGGRVLSLEQGKKFVEIWLDTQFEGGRHQNRLDKITAIEKRVNSI